MQLIIVNQVINEVKETTFLGVGVVIVVTDENLPEHKSLLWQTNDTKIDRHNLQS